MKFLKILIFIITVIGAINWGLVGLFRFDLIRTLFGDMTILSRGMYVLVGLCGLIALFSIYSSLIDDAD